MKTLRKKAEYLFKLGFNVNYFRLLLKQNKIGKEDKKVIEKLWRIVEDGM